MMSRRLILGSAVPALFALVAVVIHTPPVRSAVNSWAVTKLQSAAGVRATIARLDYNLFTLTFSAGNITLAAEGSSVPFFSAEAVRVDLPWTILRGFIAIESLEIDNPSVTIVTRGGWNAQPPDEPLELPRTPRLDRLTLADSSFGVFGSATRIDPPGCSSMPATSTSISSGRPRSLLNGRLSGREIAVRISEHETGLSKLDGRLAFDGTALALEDLAVEAPQGRLRVDGKLSGPAGVRTRRAAISRTPRPGPNGAVGRRRSSSLRVGLVFGHRRRSD